MCSGASTPWRSASRTSAPVISSISVGPVRLDVLEHRGIVGAAAPGREHVHLPRILSQRDSRRRRNPLALLDQVVDEEAEVRRPLLGGEVRIVRQTGQRGDGVDRRVEDQLRPLRRPQVGEGLGLQARGADQLGDLDGDRFRRVLVGADPRLGVEDVLDVRVGMPGAAHERDAGHQLPVAVAHARSPPRRARSGLSEPRHSETTHRVARQRARGRCPCTRRSRGRARAATRDRSRRRRAP